MQLAAPCSAICLDVCSNYICSGQQPELQPQLLRGRPDERKAPLVHALAAFACPTACQRKSIQLSRDHADAAASVSRICRMLQAPGPPVMAAFITASGCKDSCTEALLGLERYQLCCLLRKIEREAPKCLVAHMWGSDSGNLLKRRTGRTLALLSCLSPQKLLLNNRPATNLTVSVVLHVTSTMPSHAQCHAATTNF